MRQGVHVGRKRMHRLWRKAGLQVPQRRRRRRGRKRDPRTIPVTRPNQVRIRYLDYDGEIRETEAEGVLATCIQHEMDHLDGILFVDHISSLKRGIILRKLAKSKRAKAKAGT